MISVHVFSQNVRWTTWAHGDLYIHTATWSSLIKLSSHPRKSRVSSLITLARNEYFHFYSSMAVSYSEIVRLPAHVCRTELSTTVIRPTVNMLQKFWATDGFSHCPELGVVDVHTSSHIWALLYIGWSLLPISQRSVVYSWNKWNIRKVRSPDREIVMNLKTIVNVNTISLVRCFLLGEIS